MTTQTLILPYNRTSPLHIPRRDLVLSTADSLTLRVTIVESDSPSAQALYLTGGIGGPSIRLLIWADLGASESWWNSGCGCDYGAPLSARRVLFSGVGIISDAAGSFDIFLPVGTLARLPRRCGWAVHLDADAGDLSDLLAWGSLHFRHGGVRIADSIDLLTDDGDQLLGDDLIQLEA